tara:strand:- start:4173 stop:5021 length:849 start_codon:yes stop_codon:yes gene_type:complete
MNNVLYIADLLDVDIIGGGELNDAELCNQLFKKKYTINKKRSHTVTIYDCKKNDFIIISNFVNLNYNVLEYITQNCKYIIYEHDHKYLKNRNPAAYKNFKAPEHHIVHKEFYKKAKSVFCQSSFHKNIIEKNLSINNVYNVSGNLWSDESLDIISKLAADSTIKKDKISILNSTTWHKNTKECVFYCEKKKLEYELISSNVYTDFLSQLSKNKKFMFLPKTPETLSRVVVEARMLNVSTITNKNVGACHEKWISLQGNELIDYMKKNKEKTIKKIVELINEQ